MNQTPYLFQQQLLHNAFSQNRLSHAYLLSGMANIGKTEFACQFAKLLLCDEKKSCGKCRGCCLMAAQTHPDFMCIQPHEKNHSIKIDQIRELSDKLSRTAQCGGFQIVVISPADAMPSQAANALLKTLEEPAGKVVFFLIDHQQHHLPPTIASRCQKIFFYADEKIKSLIEKEHVDLFDQLVRHLDLISKRKVNSIALSPDWQKNLDMVLQLLLLICIDITRIQAHVDASHLISFANEKKLMPIAQTVDSFQLQQFISKIGEKINYCSRGMNLNQQLCLEDLFIEWEKLATPLS